LRLSCVYPLLEVRSDQGVGEVPRDIVTIHHADQRWDVVGKDSWD
jgi:hypothetical protein